MFQTSVFARDWAVVHAYFLEQIEEPVQRLRTALRRNKGVRIGEAAVVSRKMHTIHPDCPAEVQIITNSDAGQVFYQRRRPGEIIHIDLFHAVAEVDHKGVAAAVRRAVEAYNFHVGIKNVFMPGQYHTAACLDYIDVQTATGGGRVSGSLNFGKKASLRRAHANHVHIAGLIGEELLPLLFYIVAFVEQEILDQGVELRKNEILTHTLGQKNRQSDLSPYSAYSDSYLQERPADQPCSEQTSASLKARAAAELTQEYGNVKDVQEMLEMLAEGISGRKINQQLRPYGDPESIIRKLTNMGLAEKWRDGYTLSPAGRELCRYFSEYAREIAVQLKKMFRQVPLMSGEGKYRTACKTVLRPGTTGIPAGVQPVPAGNWLGEIAVGETVLAAAKRTLLRGGSLAITREDIREQKRLRPASVAICLLVDASASMAGSRIKAAKQLSKHLLLSTRDKVAVVVFQEQWAKVEVPFTRDYQQVEAGLKEIRSFGSTPLAQAIKYTVNYLGQAAVKNPLLFLITDGVPTVADTTRDAVHDAIEAAKLIKERRIQFACIGLQPHRHYLEQLVLAGGGTLYILDELEKHRLLQIALQERSKVL